MGVGGGGGGFYSNCHCQYGKLTVLAEVTSPPSLLLYQLRFYQSSTGDLMSMIFFFFTDVLVQVLLTGMQMTSVRFPVRAFLSLH